MTVIGLGWVSALALISAPAVEKTQRLRLRASALAGADSNLRQSAGSEGWSAAAATQLAGSARFPVGEDVVGFGAEAVFDLGEGADRAHRATLGVDGLWSRWGSRSSESPLRIDLRGFYRTGARLDGRPRSVGQTSPAGDPSDGDPNDGDEADADEADEADAELAGLDGVDGGASLAFFDPFHDVGAQLSFHYRPGSRTRLRFRGSLRRSWRSAEPSQPARHFTEVAGRLGWRERLHPSLFFTLRYGLGARGFDERSDGRGGRLLYLVHRPRAELRARWGRLRGRLGYGLRVLDANRAERSRLRHEGWVEARWSLDARWAWLTRIDLAREIRWGRPDRSWSRVRAVAGVAVVL